MQKILIVVDMQNDFVSGSLGTDEAKAILDNVQSKIKSYKNDNYEIILTKDTHFDDYLETQEGKKLPVKHCIKDTYGWEFADEIRKTIDISKDKVFEKVTFGSIDLAKYLSKKKEIDEIEIIGLCTDICVVSNALLIKAFLPELKITVDSNCCAGVTVQSHLEALNTMKMCHINII